MAAYSSRVLVFLWSAALVFSGLTTFSGTEPLETTWVGLITVVSGLALLATPRSLFTLRLSVVSYLVTFIAQMPANPNHRWILLFVALAILARIKRIKRVDDLALETRASLRWITCIVYFFATLAKLNSAYFDPQISCASFFSNQTLALYGLGGLNIFGGSNTVATVSTLIEGLLPLLLLWPRSRQVAILIGILFHILLSLNLARYFGNFSSVMFVLLGSWLPEESCKRICRAVANRGKPALRVWGASLLILFVLSLTQSVSVSEFAITRHVLFLAYALGLLFIVGIGAFGVRCHSGIGRPCIALVVLAIANGLTPYIGAKTRSAFTMYSNLRVEPGYSNHLFMPDSPDLLGYLADRVEIVSTTDQGLQQRLEQSSRELPYISLCAYLACQDDLCRSSERTGGVSYIRAGVRIEHELSGPLPRDCPAWIVRKILFFGPLGSGSERICLW
jgi:hypothetical protein